MFDELPDDTRVLVVVVTQVRDLEHARNDGWYRIPLRRAPAVLAAEYLAFYQTAVFGAERWAVRFIAPVMRVSLATRRALLPDEPDHPRADERYYRFDLGLLHELPFPLTSRRLRRICFIPTTLGQLISVGDVAELWRAQEDHCAARAAIWGAGLAGRHIAQNQEPRDINHEGHEGHEDGDQGLWIRLGLPQLNTQNSTAQKAPETPQNSRLYRTGA